MRDAQDKRAVAALTMHGPLPRLSLENCEASVPRLLQAAQRISRAWALDLTDWPEGNGLAGDQHRFCQAARMERAVPPATGRAHVRAY